MDRDLPRGLKLATVWLLVGAALFLAVQWWQQRALQTRFHVEGRTVEIRRGADGHYHWPGRVNGRAVEFLIDTGATGTAIPASLARELKLASLGEIRSDTAGGTVSAQIVRADIELQGGVRVQRLQVAALPRLADDTPLLGMDVLGRLRLQQRDSVLRIELDGAR